MLRFSLSECTSPSRRSNSIHPTHMRPVCQWAAAVGWSTGVPGRLVGVMTSTPKGPSMSALFTRGSWPEAARITEILRREAVGGIILLVAALAALIWANSPWAEAYFDLAGAHVGPESLHLDLSIAHWASDGL